MKIVRFLIFGLSIFYTGLTIAQHGDAQHGDAQHGDAQHGSVLEEQDQHKIVHADSTPHITLYYDSEKKVPKEIFQVAENNPKVLQGAYTAFYADGKTKIKGHYEHNVATGRWEYFYENGNPKMRGILQNNVNNGLWEYFYENGHLQMKGVVMDSTREGPWQFYFEKGSLKSEGNFLDGKRDDLWKYYYEDAKLKAEEDFKGDSSIYREFYASGRMKLMGKRINGQSEGKWTQYFENGLVKAEGNYEHDIRQGRWKFYHENGNLASTGDFLKGASVGKWTYYYENGKLSAEGAEKNGLKEGYWKLYQSDGDFKGEAIFNQGEGIYQEFYPDGTIKVKGNMANGVHQGKWQYYYQDGSLEGDAVFKDGKGTYYGYYHDGSLKMQGTIENGERTGVWKLFKPDGQLAGYYTSVYENNEPIFKALRDSAENEKEEASKTAALNPEYLYRKRTLRYFKPRINELKSLIIGINPVALILYRLPVSLEYYMQERLGYELEIGLVRDPFFVISNRMEVNTPYQRGFFVGLKQKFYHEDTRSGMFYFGHRLGFDYINHDARIAEVNVVDGTLLTPPVTKVLASEQRASYSVLLGTRLMKDTDIINTRITKDAPSPGLTFDLFGGIGIGYRFFDQYFTENKYQEILKDIPKSKVYFPIEFGATVGYAF